MHVSKGMLRIFIIYVVIAISVFGYFSWTNHWYKVFEDRYYAYIPVNSFIAICYPCEDVKYLENDSGLLIGFGNDYSQIAKINRYGGEPREIGNPDSKLHIFAAIAMHFDKPLVKDKFIPITVQIMENGYKKVLTGRNDSYEEKMKSWRIAAKEMRAESDNILGHLMTDLMILLFILTMPALLYCLYLWIKKGFELNR